MKVYVVADLDYFGGVLDVYTDKAEAEKVAKERHWNHPKVIERYEYEVYERELHTSNTKANELDLSEISLDPHGSSDDAPIKVQSSARKVKT